MQAMGAPLSVEAASTTVAAFRLYQAEEKNWSPLLSTGYI
jgi:hypothetical protein